MIVEEQSEKSLQMNEIIVLIFDVKQYFDFGVISIQSQDFEIIRINSICFLVYVILKLIATVLLKVSKMKTENQDLSLDSTRLSISQSQSILTDVAIKCCQSKEAHDFCCNDKCTKKHVFVCHSKGCKCKSDHQGCLKGDIDYTLKIINSKIYNTDDIKSYIKETIQKMIDQLSKLRQQLLKDVDKRIKYTQLYEVEKKFIEISTNQLDSSSLNGQQTALLWNILKMKSQTKNSIFDAQKKALKSFEDKSNASIVALKKQIQQIIKKQSLDQSKLSFNNNNNQTVHQSLALSSSICTNFDLFVKLGNMFSRKIKKIDIIFKASVHNFSLPKYYDICGSVENTIVLALTNKDKIFGGFTPFCFYSGKDEWMVDSKKESFLFSLSQNQKFNLTNQNNNCIYRRASKQQYIQFGGDFYIYHNANTNNSNNVGSKSFYASNPKYDNNKQSWLKLNGNESYKCTLKQWQVFKVQFQQ